MTKLSVNINKIATLRNARGGDNPNVVTWATKIEALGVHGITVHPRPDERHIRRSDVHALAKVLKVEFNIEGYPSDEFIQLIQESKPQQTTLVPDPPDVLTSCAGWQVLENETYLRERLQLLGPSAGRISLFFDPLAFQPSDLKEALMLVKDMGGHRLEIYTEPFAKAYTDSLCNPKSQDLAAVLSTYTAFAQQATQFDIKVNAGHDLDLNNLPLLLMSVPNIAEVSIGHALVCDALLWGMPETISRYLAAVKRPQQV